MYCETDGSDHYKGNLQPMDLIISEGFSEDFCISNIIKYSVRFKKTRNLDDLKKVVDYAHILCGSEVIKRDNIKQAHLMCDSTEHHSLISGDIIKNGNIRIKTEFDVLNERLCNAMEALSAASSGVTIKIDSAKLSDETRNRLNEMAKKNACNICIENR